MLRLLCEPCDALAAARKSRSSARPTSEHAVEELQEGNKQESVLEVSFQGASMQSGSGGACECCWWGNMLGAVQRAIRLETGLKPGGAALEMPCGGESDVAVLVEPEA